MDKQENMEAIAGQAEALLQEGLHKADALLIKTASIRTQLDQLRRELREQLSRQGLSTSSRTQ